MLTDKEFKIINKAISLMAHANGSPGTVYKNDVINFLKEFKELDNEQSPNDILTSRSDRCSEGKQEE